jgi:hypothetical protein
VIGRPSLKLLPPGAKGTLSKESILLVRPMSSITYRYPVRRISWSFKRVKRSGIERIICCKMKCVSAKDYTLHGAATQQHCPRLFVFRGKPNPDRRLERLLISYLQVRAETTAQLQAEFQDVLTRTRADFERAEQAANTKVRFRVLHVRDTALSGVTNGRFDHFQASSHLYAVKSLLERAVCK